jgi:DNA-binding winged helix-turn-helix (wHTH) protein
MSGKALEDDFRVDEETFAFGSFRLMPAQRMLLEGGRPLRLGSRALDILITLVESAGEMIHKERLIARTWPPDRCARGPSNQRYRHGRAR